MGYNLKVIRQNASLANTSERICTKCEILKPLSEYSYRTNKTTRFSHCKSCVRINQITKKMGISPEFYLQMVKDHGGKCSICNVYESTLAKGLAVDHDHETGKIRGLLCSQCNTGLGMFKDSLTFLTNAIDYLKRTKE